MLREQPKEKDRRRVAIPEDLREALCEAWFLINESKRDRDVRVDYGDAIQCGGCLVGGSVGSSKRPYEFTYHVRGQGDKAHWHLIFHPLEIEDIADGHVSELTLYCCRTPGCGHKTTDPTVLCHCDYVDDLYFGNIEFPTAAEALCRLGISGISASSSCADVTRVLGEPTNIGGGVKDATFRYIRPWIKYHRPDCQLRFEFDEAGQVAMISIMEAEWEPGK